QEVNTFLVETKSFTQKVLECHPELAFTRLTLDKVALTHSKKTAEGKVERMKLLEEVSDAFKKHRERIEATELFQKYSYNVMDAFCIAIVVMLGEHKGFITITKVSWKVLYELPLLMVFFDR